MDMDMGSGGIGTPALNIQLTFSACYTFNTFKINNLHTNLKYTADFICLKSGGWQEI